MLGRRLAKANTIAYHRFKKRINSTDTFGYQLIYGNIDEKETKKIIGILRKTPTRCSCCMCGNPRKCFNEITIQEKKEFEINPYEDIV